VTPPSGSTTWALRWEDEGLDFAAGALETAWLGEHRDATVSEQAAQLFTTSRDQV
jgi:hypothetical protein